MINQVKKISGAVGKVGRHFLPSKKHSAVYGLFFVSILIVGFTASAAPVGALLEIVGQGIAFGMAWLMSNLATLFLKVAIFFLRFFVVLSAYNGFLDSPVVKIGWVMVRDLANMFFVVALLVIAFATILGKESYEWTKIMVKLVLAAIFVNFSALICGLIIDVAHVFTITFLNAIAPVAGGNFISMFKLSEIRAFVDPGDGVGGSRPELINTEIFMASVFSVMMAGMAMVIMGAYVGIMLFRMIFLWILIILSPLAFVFSVLPATQDKARDWWDHFVKYVLVGPVMVFFLWLAFATMGAGRAADDLNEGLTIAGLDLDPNSADQRVSTNLASTWHNLASFLIALGFFAAGVEQVQKLGVKGSEWAQTGVDFGKKVGLFMSGVAAARFVAGTVKDEGTKMAGEKVKDTLKYMPLGGEFWADKWHRIGEFRKYNPLINRIPLIGRFGEMYWKKQRQRNEQNAKRREQGFIDSSDVTKMQAPMLHAATNFLPNLFAKAIGDALHRIQTKDGQPLDERLDLQHLRLGHAFDLLGTEHFRNLVTEPEEQAASARENESAELRKSKNERDSNLQAMELILGMGNENFDAWAKKNGLQEDYIERFDSGEFDEEFKDSLLRDRDLRASVILDLEKDPDWEHKTESEKNEEIKNEVLVRGEAQKDDRKADLVRSLMRGDEDINNAYKSSKDYHNLQEEYDNIDQMGRGNRIFGPGVRERVTRNRAKQILESQRGEVTKEQVEAARDGAVLAAHQLEEAEDWRRDYIVAHLTKERGAKTIEALREAHADEEIMAAREQLQMAMESGDPEAVKKLVDENKIAGALYADHQAILAEAKTEEAKSRFNEALGKTGIGKELFEELAKAEVGKKIGEEFIQQIKDTKVKAEFEKAKVKLDNLQKNASRYNTPEAMQSALHRILDEDKFAMAIHTSEEAAAASKESDAARDNAIKAHADAQYNLSKLAGQRENEFRTARERQAESDVLKTAIGSYLGTKSKSDERFEHAAEHLAHLNEPIRQLDKEIADGTDEHGNALSEPEISRKRNQRARLASHRDEELHKDSYLSELYYAQLHAEDAAREKRYKTAAHTEALDVDAFLKSVNEEVRQSLSDLGDNKIKIIKNAEIGRRYEESKTKLWETEKRLKAEAAAKGEKYSIDSLREAVADDPLVRAALLAREGKDDALLTTMSQKQFTVDVGAKIYDPAYRGKATAAGVSVEFVEAYKREYDLMSEVERGEFVFANQLLLNRLRRTGQDVTAKHRNYAAASYESGQYNGNVDDAFAAMAKNMNLLDRFQALREKFGGDTKKMLDSGEMSSDDLQFVLDNEEDLEFSKNLALKYNWIIKRHNLGTGKVEWVDRGDAQRSATYELFMNTGADLELLEVADGIARVQDLHPELAFNVEEAAKLYFQENADKLNAPSLTRDHPNSIQNFQALQERYAQYQDTLRSFSESRKERSKTTGHLQLGFNLMYDPNTGMVRMFSKDEQTAMRNGTVNKDPNTRAMPQGFGHYDDSQGIQVYVDGRLLQNHNLGSAKTVQDFLRKADERVRRTVFMGAHRDHKTESISVDVPGKGGNYAALGQSEEIIRYRGFNDEDIGAFDAIFNGIGQALAGGGNDLAMSVAVETGQNRIAAENGHAKMTLVGKYSNQLASDTTSEFSRKMREFMGAMGDTNNSKRQEVTQRIFDKLATETDQNVRLQLREKIRQFASKADRLKAIVAMMSELEDPAVQADEILRDSLEQQIKNFEAETGENSQEYDWLMKELEKVETNVSGAEEDYASYAKKGASNNPNNPRNPVNDPDLQ